MVNVWDYNDISGRVRITCADDQILRGRIISVDDEEESGLGEDGISLMTDDGKYIGIGQSEIASIIEERTINPGT